MPSIRPTAPSPRGSFAHASSRLAIAVGLVGLLSSCATSGGSAPATVPVSPMSLDVRAPSPDPRIGLAPGLTDAAQAAWNLRLVSATQPPDAFVGFTNSDLAFLGNYAIQGNYNGFLVWDISNPARPTLAGSYPCPASQNDVSVYRNLLFVSAEAYNGRLDCGGQGVSANTSPERVRGVRIFDISDIRNPRYVHTVQTCRGSHTHSLLVPPNDSENVYVYISGSAPVRPSEELVGCSEGLPDENPNTALFRIEVIQVPLADPTRATIVSSPRIFAGLVAPEAHGPAPDDLAEVERARARGAFVVTLDGEPYILSNQEAAGLLAQVVAARGGSGAPTAADSATLRAALPSIVAQMEAANPAGPEPGPTQCHDITLFPELGLGGGACEGYGFLIDISDPARPVRLGEVSDINFSYWHSATFNNDGTKVLFTDEWGGGVQAKCRASDPMEWGADAIFSIENRQMVFQSYYKMPAEQTTEENCVAHNGSLIPVPGRDIMVQSWYQGGVSVFDFTDAANPVEIAFFDRGPVNGARQVSGGTWSAYWYNGVIVSSEIARGLDILELVPGPALTQNEIDAARSVRMEYFNPQGQVRYTWPATFALARAYADQLERSGGLSAARLAAARTALTAAERATGNARRDALRTLAGSLDGDVSGSADPGRVQALAGAVRGLAGSE